MLGHLLLVELRLLWEALEQAVETPLLALETRLQIEKNPHGEIWEEWAVT